MSHVAPALQAGHLHLFKRNVAPTPDVSARSGTGVATRRSVQSTYRQKLGKQAEDLASRELAARVLRFCNAASVQGGEKLTSSRATARRSCSSRCGARAGEDYGSAEESITARKEWRMTRMAEAYLFDQRLGDVDCRFDVVAVDWSTPEPVLTVYRSAFDAVD